MKKPNKITTLILLISFQTIFSYGDYFDSLKTDRQLVLLDSVINGYVIDDCCDTTLVACLTLKPNCIIASRFYNFASWMIMKDNSYDKSIKQLRKRYLSLYDTTKCFIKQNPIELAGDKASPNIITIYVSATCPLCKKVSIPLYMCVQDNTILGGKATLSLKPITTGVGDRALMAANEQGRFWDYFLSLEKVKKRIDEKLVFSKAKKLNLNMEQFEKALTNSNYIKILKKNREEAWRNGASITPTLYINDRRYQSYKDPQWVVDAVLTMSNEK